MAILGYADLKDTSPHSLWDLAEMKKVQLASGRTFDEMLTELQAALDLVNGDFLADPYYSNLIAVQDMVEIEADTDNGSVDFIRKVTDASRLDPMKGDVTGWSLPCDYKGGALGWTMLGLRQRSETQIRGDLRRAINGIKKDLQKTTLTRMFKSTAELVGTTAGASVPFCDGGTADASFVPPEFDGQTFAYTHNHFLRHAAISDANVQLTMTHLREHGHMGPYIITASLADKSTWTGLTNFYAPKWDAVDFMQDTNPRAMFMNDEMFIGVWEGADGVAFIKLTARVPTGYYAMHKAYGQLDPRNPLRMRINPQMGYGYKIVPGNWVGAPHLLAVVMAEYGIGIGEMRTNGVCVYINASGSYTDPTIS